MPIRKNTALIKARKAKGLTQQEVADAIGMTRIQYNRIENGNGTTLDTMAKICKFLGVKLKIESKGE